MLKLLLSLWAVKTRRGFKWGRFLGQAYVLGVYLMVVGIITYAIYEESGTSEGIEVSVPLLATLFIVPDFINKLLLKHDETVMDHYLKSRPIPDKSWNLFLIITNLTDYWNWLMPVTLLPFVLLFLPWPLMLPSLLLIAAISMVGGVAITTMRHARGWTNKWPVLAFIVTWALIATAYAPLVFIMPWGVHVAGFLLLCAGALAVLYDYLCELRRYDESKDRGRRLLLGASSSLFSMEYLCILRSKRLRIAVLILPLVFVANSYTNSLNGVNWTFYMMVMFAVIAPSMMIGQWVFGVEANYFDGLWTKPVSIRQILYNKFWFFALIDSIPVLLLIPLIWTVGLSPWMLAATWVFNAGLVNLLMMPTCLISSRIELFQSAFFNFQGASLSINVYGFVILLPVALYCVAASLLDATTAAAILAGLGIVGFALSSVVLNRLARRYEECRHTCFERYRAS